MQDPDIVDDGGFTVVGLHYQGSNQQGELASLWETAGESWDELGAIAADDDAYGVSYGGDPETGEFEYVAGVRADPDATIPGEYTAVDVPESTYAVFETTLSSIQETMNWVHGEWLAESGYELAMGPEVEIYDDAFDSTDPDAVFDVYVPVEAEESA
ncbi:MAG: GyrI-like domain-containing protein [Halanaeroarchaeum sp.]